MKNKNIVPFTLITVFGLILGILLLTNNSRVQSRSISVDWQGSVGGFYRQGGSRLLPELGLATFTPTPNYDYLPLVMRPFSTPTPTPTPTTTRTIYSSADCGRTFTIQNGNYSRLSISAQCSAAAPLTIRAQSPGYVRFNGNGSVRPCEISGSSNVELSGVLCYNSPGMVFNLSNSNHLTLRNITAYQAGPNYGDHVVEIYRSSYLLLEDMAATGRGRNPYIVFESDHITCRRCFGRYAYHQTGTNPQGADVFQIYGASNVLLENFIGYRVPSGIYVDAGQFWFATWNRPQDVTNDNAIVGSLFVGHDYHGLNIISAQGQLHRSRVDNSVFIGNNTGAGFGTPFTALSNRADDSFTVDHTTLVNHQTGLSMSHDTSNPWLNIGTTIKNTSIVNASVGLNRASYSQITTNLIHSYNNFWNVATLYSGTSAGTGESSLNPGYATSTYGNGAYLFIPPALRNQGENSLGIGADLRYFTSDPAHMWPWPMEARICAETANLLGAGVSVTWESSTAAYDYNNDGTLEGYSCSGGVWRTLDGVY
jgi:hypothetical protein